MSSDDTTNEKRIKKLEKDLQEKNSLLLIYKEEITKMNERLAEVLSQIEDELEIASALQNLMVSTEIPKIPGFAFSSKFKAGPKAGGDYFEIVHHEDKYKFGILMATSSGYSMSALFLSVLLKITAKFNSKKGYSPIEFVEKIQAEVRQHMKEKDSFSLLYVVVDRKKNSLSYSGCGDMAFLRWNSKKAEVESLEMEKEALCKSKNLSFSQNQVNFFAEDRFIMASKGFIQQKNKKGNPYGIDSLTRLLYENANQTIHETRNNYFVDIEKYSKGQEDLEDWTLLIMDVKTNIIKLAVK